jgi:hypothetical protein
MEAHAIEEEARSSRALGRREKEEGEECKEARPVRQHGSEDKERLLTSPLCIYKVLFFYFILFLFSARLTFISCLACLISLSPHLFIR